MAKSYNRYGGHATLSPIGDFLLSGAPEFGDAIREITVTLHFPHSGPAKKTLEQLLERHNSFRTTLPKITYRRAKKTVEIDIASDLMDNRDWKHSPRLSLPLFGGAVTEIVGALPLIRKRMKASESFDLAGFLSHCDEAICRVPRDEDDFQLIAAQLRAADQLKRDAMSPWDKLGLDWNDFHPRARIVLDDPFYWDCADDFSPNGNDTGADLLEDYRDWIKAHRTGAPLRFLEKLAKQWGYQSTNEMDTGILDQAAIGLAFADIKLRGECHGDARKLAMTSIHRQRIEAEAATGWPHRDERMRTLEMIERKLQQADDIHIESNGSSQPTS